MENMQKLIDIMAKLRDPKDGCAWDVEQTFETIAPYTIEEAYEVSEAIDNNDMDALKDELGDLLFQAVFHARMAEEAGHFNFDDVVGAISDKMIRRHPHVFGDENYRNAEEQTVAWEEQKAKERAAKKQHSILDGVTVGLPALTRAVKLQKRAARVGFDWPETSQVVDKLNEEMAELSAELVAENKDHDKIEEEFGDMMFVYANLARHLKIDPEQALKKANNKFTRRFNQIETEVENSDKSFDEYSLDELEEMWVKAKKAEK
ncbi:nucleoside triphosphate pyrophosphohydrolase [Pseudemcibacter aquimaris]|uniref:nucleoside triphosphate pyrophosphohydrolase n=1 Tax=Pseudemcibacter aquimaris TaxID=2857064 RepID=UPI0020129999|nr:nucleoside triphosphate pyrophosphohydrolase [Pseudemcibacter aquimaris]WDU59758.1 nucleoside triphosphate pyrophosphohydrolase [Pseudemcibacter aquimaris]